MSNINVIYLSIQPDITLFSKEKKQANLLIINFNYYLLIIKIIGSKTLPLKAKCFWKLAQIPVTKTVCTGERPFAPTDFVNLKHELPY